MSLRLRLALSYGTLTGLVVALLVGLTYVTHSRDQYDGIDAAMAGALNHAISENAASASAPQLAEIVATPPAPGLEVRVFDARGRLLAESRGAGRSPRIDPEQAAASSGRTAYGPLVGLAPQLTHVDRGTGVFSVVAATDGQRWRVDVVRLGRSGRYLAAAAPLGPTDAAVAQLGWILAVLGGSGVVATLGAAWLVAGRALSPVRTVTSSAADIANSRDMQRRVPAGRGGDELGVLARTFNEMLSSLDGAYRQQQRFIADASHELRAPLTAVQANLELLEEFPSLPPEERGTAVAEASQEAGRMARLVADLLALARADAGAPMRSVRVELDQVVLEAAREARLLANGQRVEIELLAPAVVDGDPDRLKQALLIALDNAVRYTPPGARIAVAMRVGESAVEVTVSDDGPGIAGADLPHVFEPFYRADPARRRDPGGTGLGLSIARSIAERHRGSVEVSSRPGEGTMVLLRLPLVDAGQLSRRQRIAS